MLSDLNETKELGRSGESDRLTLRGAYTLGRFQYVEDAEYGGKEIPGVPRHYLTAEVKYEHPSGFSLAPALEWVPESYYVNSSNTAASPATAHSTTMCPAGGCESETVTSTMMPSVPSEPMKRFLRS